MPGWTRKLRRLAEAARQVAAGLQDIRITTSFSADPLITESSPAIGTKY